MKLFTDHSFHIGEQHLRQGKPCQDYALSGSLGRETAYAIVSDGCSSGGMTDIGSRLMTLATLRALHEQIPSNDFATRDSDIARDTYLESSRLNLRLETKDLLATCLWAVVHKNEVVINVTGDGVVALEFEAGMIIKTFSWQKNMPYYPAYRIGGMDEPFTENHSDNLAPLTIIESVIVTPGGDVQLTNNVVTKGVSVREGMRGIVYTESIINTALGNLRTVALFSDGIEQIDQIETVSAVKALLSFKSVSGQFAVRRMNRFLQDVKKQGRGPIDDIAYAVIHSENKETDHVNNQTTEKSNT
ncbi:MAG: protein phosphatase 2C domain-containing protein [Candidatus Nomurabacteria bacterium]|nr:MAG: protein phosphatase 2C domain-containing protein [Candidatus Nomurabacteria bacterium]